MAVEGYFKVFLNSPAVLSTDVSWLKNKSPAAMWAMLSFYTATLTNLLNSSKAVIKVLPHMAVCVSRVINC